MKLVAWHGLVVVLMLLLAGCGSPGDGPPTGTETSMSTVSPVPFVPQCTDMACTADPDDPQAKEILGRYGWHQLNNDTWGDNPWTFCGNWFLWGPYSGGGSYQSLVAYNFATEELVQVSQNRTEWFAVGHACHGDIVIYDEQDVNQTLPYRPFMFNLSSGQRTPLDYGEPAGFTGGFDGKWVLIQVFGEQGDADSGYWVYNLLTKERRQIARDPLWEDWDNGRSETPTARLVNGHVYVLFNHHEHTSTPDLTRLVDVNLTNATSKELYRTPRPLALMDANEKYVVWEPGGYNPLMAYTISNGTVAEFSAGFENNYIHLGGDWVTWSRNPPSNIHTIMAYHIPTRKSFALGSTDNFHYVVYSANDNTRAATVLTPRETEVDGKNWQNHNEDIYWRYLPDPYAR